MNSKFEDLPQYHFDRDDFIKIFQSVFSGEDIYEIESICEGNQFIEDFHLFHDNDEYYILHMPSGTMINWYKHLGRTNTCNKDLDHKDLKEFLEMLRDDLVGYDS